MYVKRSKMDWTDHNCIVLVREYKGHPVLFDWQYKYYKVAAKKNEAWAEIGRKMDMPVSDLKRKMQSLLAGYRRERNKVRDGEYKGTWFAFEEFAFLGAKFQEKVNLKWEILSDNSDPIDATEDTLANVEEDLFDTNNIEEEKPLRRTRKSFRPPQRSLRKRNALSAPSTTIEATAPSHRQAKLLPAKKDTYDKFGEYIAGELRELDTYSAAYVQKLFSDIVFDAKMGKYSLETSST